MGFGSSKIATSSLPPQLYRAPPRALPPPPLPPPAMAPPQTTRPQPLQTSTQSELELDRKFSQKQQHPERQYIFTGKLRVPNTPMPFPDCERCKKAMYIPGDGRLVCNDCRKKAGEPLWATQDVLRIGKGQ